MIGQQAQKKSNLTNKQKKSHSKLKFPKNLKNTMLSDFMLNGEIANAFCAG